MRFWNRFLSSQMSQAIISQTTVDIKAGDYLFKTGASKIMFDGYTAVYEVEKEKEDEEDESGERIKRGDPRAAHFKNDYGDFGAEVEAIEVYYPGLLAQRVEDAVNDVIDSGIWVASKKTEDLHLEEIIK